MVHKKSEYQLNYKWNPSTLYHEAWQNGLAYRVQRRLHDYSHLPLPWEVHSCKCDDETTDEEEEARLPLPKTRLKHNILNEVYQTRNKERTTQFINGPGNGTNEDWYRRWEERKHQLSPTPKIQTWSRKISSPEKNLPAIEGGRTDQEKWLAERQEQCRSSFENVGEKRAEESKTYRDASPSRSIAAQFTQGTQTLPATLPTRALPSAHKKDLQVAQPQTQSNCCMPKFLPYGWASKRDVSDKKTFNVFAPTRHLNQFYPSALRAWKRKEDEEALNVEPDLKQRGGRSSAFPNTSSLWMTEYQKQFTERRAARPTTAPAWNIRPVSSAYHKYCT